MLSGRTAAEPRSVMLARLDAVMARNLPLLLAILLQCVMMVVDEETDEEMG